MKKPTLTEKVIDEVLQDSKSQVAIGTYIDKNHEFWIGFAVFKLKKGQGFSIMKKRISRMLKREFGHDVSNV